MGLPITQSSLCRLYINNKSYGLYELSDMYKKKFVKRFFNPPVNSDNKSVFGTLYKVFIISSLFFFLFIKIFFIIILLFKFHNKINFLILLNYINCYVLLMKIRVHPNQ